MARLINRQTDRLRESQTSRQFTYSQIQRNIDGPMNRFTDTQMDRRTEGQTKIDRKTDRQIHNQVTKQRGTRKQEHVDCLTDAEIDGQPERDIQTHDRDRTNRQI